MKRIYGVLKSVKFAVFLITFLVITSIIASLVPQGQKLAFYYGNYPRFIADIIVKIHLHHFFRSVLLLIPAALFFINLLLCTLERIKKHSGQKKNRNYGPDIIHVGILIMMISFTITMFNRQEGLAYLRRGESLKLPNNKKIILKSFTFLKYKDGRPKDYISKVILKQGNKIIKEAVIKVNNPLSVDGYSIYQNSYKEKQMLVLKEKEGADSFVMLFKSFKHKGRTYYFKGVKKIPSHSEANKIPLYKALIGEFKNKKMVKMTYVLPGAKIGGKILEKIQVYYHSGLSVVKDPGFQPFVVSTFLICIGLFMTFYKKIGELT